jgi:hypothetical protein
MGANGSKLYHLSTMAVVEMMRADFSHKSIPMETPGNKPIPITRQYFGAAALNQGFDQQEAKELTSNGISTAIYWESNWRIWGDHTAAYTYGGSFHARAIFDTSMRMLMHITNSFQREWGTSIDEPMPLPSGDNPEPRAGKARNSQERGRSDRQPESLLYGK